MISFKTKKQNIYYTNMPLHHTPKICTHTHMHLKIHLYSLIKTLYNIILIILVSFIFYNLCTYLAYIFSLLLSFTFYDFLIRNISRRRIIYFTFLFQHHQTHIHIKIHFCFTQTRRHIYDSFCCILLIYIIFICTIFFRRLISSQFNIR